MKRGKPDLSGEAVERDADAETEFVAAVEEGLRELEAGDVVDHASVVADFEGRKRRR